MKLANVKVWLNMRRKYVIGAVLLVVTVLALWTLQEGQEVEVGGRAPATVELKAATELYYWKQQKVQAVNNEYWPRATGDRYLAFKSWHAGFNNERISLELAFIFAGLTNRTLVLPPGYRHYNLKQFMYEKFFELEDMNKAMPVITYKEFAEKEGITGSYDNIASKATILKWPDFPSSKSIFVYPEVPDKEREPEEYARMAKFARPRRMGLIRDMKTDSALKHDRIVYFPDHQLFTHFYAYIYIRDPHLDRYMKRLVRDFVHLRSDIYDTAGVILRAMPKDFYTIHFRRGDFQYKNQRSLSGQTILNNIKSLVPSGSTIYLATDESDMKVLQNEFLVHFQDHYKVIMYKDYASLVEKYIQPNWIGILEQIICSRGIKFIGTKLSTYSGYITRIRGYSPDIEDKNIYFTDTKYPEGYKDDRVFSKEFPRWGDYWLDHGLWAREFEEVWEGIDEL
jgi:hypothetical protein